MAILTQAGRTAIAKSIAEQPLHFAWGTGAASWATDTPAEDVSAQALINEVGRRLATSVQYVVPDAEGDVIVPVLSDANGNSVVKRFRLVDYPTPNLYMRFNYEFGDAPNSVIRELAVFVGTQVVAGLPIGQRYFVPAEVADPGLMLTVENLTEPIIRSATARQSFEFVLTI